MAWEPSWKSCHHRGTRRGSHHRVSHRDLGSSGVSNREIKGSNNQLSTVRKPENLFPILMFEIILITSNLYNLHYTFC